MKAFFIGSLGVWSKGRYYLWNAGFPCHLKINIGPEELGCLRGDTGMCVWWRLCTGGHGKAGAVGAGSHNVRCCDLAPRRRNGESTTWSELGTEIEPNCAFAALELGCWWDSRWQGGQRRSNGPRDIDV